MIRSLRRRVRIGGTVVALMAGLVAVPTVAGSAHADDAGPSITVSQTTVNANGAAVIKVSGEGFDPALATGSRPPLAGKPSGVYVAFGKFADEWKPSAGAPMSARPTADTRWAVMAEDIDTIGGPAAGGVELSPEGTFTAFLTIDKSAADAEAADITGGRYGVYTYPGGGAAQPLYETFTELTFVDGPTVSVDRTEFLANDQVAITVTGAGFDPALAIGSRPPLPGKPSGVYIAFGKFPFEWKPSMGAPMASRPTADTRWAVMAEDIDAIGGPGDGAIELTADGTFTATLTVDKSAADNAAAAFADGIYGVYTYPGGGAAQPLYETFTPITFEPVAPTVALTAAASSVGKAATAAVTVSVDRITPTGDVTIRNGATVLGTATLVNGKATVQLPARFNAGRHTLTAQYTGDDNVTAGSATATLRVNKAPSRVAAKVAKKRVKRGKRVRLTIRVGSPVKGVRPSAGKVRVKMRGFSKVVKINKAGKARVVLPARKRAGKFKVVVTYRGAANFKAARTRVVQRVVR